MTGLTAPPRQPPGRVALHPGATEVRQPPPDARPWWTEALRIRVVIGVAILLALLALGLMFKKAHPKVVLEARSHAVVFVPSRALDLVTAVAPRHGLEPGGTPFTGIRFTPALPNDASLHAFAGAPLPASPNALQSLQRLEVTAGCAVRLEHYIDRLIRLDVERPVGSTTPCQMSADLTLADSRNLLPVEVRRAVEIGAPATLIFAPPHPLHFRNVPVSAIRFETSDTGLVRSAIIGAHLELPDVGAVGAAAATAHVGDAVVLGELEGSIAELIVRDTVRTLFKGTASQPSIARRDLRPPLLEHLAHTHWRLAVAFLAAGLGLLAHFLPKPRP